VTNNRAELTGYIRVLETAIHQRWKQVHVIFDSMYVLKGSSEWMAKWIKAGWKKSSGDAISNRDGWERVNQLQIHLKSEGVKVTRQWVKGHSGVEGNEIADQLVHKARQAAKNGEKRDVITMKTEKEVKRKPKASVYNKLLAGKTMLFYTNAPRIMEDGYHVYTMNSYYGKNPLGELHGVDSVDAHYSVIMTKDPVTQIDDIMRVQDKVTPDDFVHPVAAIMSSIVKPVNWEVLTETKGVHLKHRRLSLETMEGEPITNYIRPPRTAYMAMDKLSFMIGQLTSIREDSIGKDKLHDVTDLFYEKDKKGNLKITEGLKSQSIKIPVKMCGKTVSLTLSLGIDIPPRNNFTAIGKATKDIKIQIYTYDAMKNNFRYGLVITTDDDYALYRSSANLKMV